MAADIMQSYGNPFKHTAAGELGVNRDTMLQNELLLRVGYLVFWSFHECVIHFREILKN